MENAFNITATEATESVQSPSNSSNTLNSRSLDTTAVDCADENYFDEREDVKVSEDSHKKRCQSSLTMTSKGSGEKFYSKQRDSSLSSVYIDDMARVNPEKSGILLGRYGLLLTVLSLNAGLIILILFAAPAYFTVVVIALFKARDILSVVWQSFHWIIQLVFGRKAEKSKNQRKLHILSMVPVYKESTEQILSTIDSIIDDNSTVEQQNGSNLICLFADGFAIDTNAIMTTDLGYLQDVEYTRWTGERSSFNMLFGYRNGSPVVALLKSVNAGKKDSLLLSFDLFNTSLHGNIPETNLLARQVVMHTIRQLFGMEPDAEFDYFFATDADTIVLPKSVPALIERLEAESADTVAACGLVEVDWSRKSNNWRNCGLARFWDHFQGFQYLYGQWVRRRAESTWGRVTCLPGAISLFRSGDYLGRACVLYRQPILSRNMILHQVQYLGTDRRLTWSLLALSPSVRTVLETKASCYTMPPQNLKHYLSQRRRWGSNAFFNAIMMLFTPKQFAVTRGWMTLEVLRTGLIFFRLANFGHFLFTLVTSFDFIAILPLLVVTLLPQIWFILVIVPCNRRYWQAYHHIAYGELINRTVGLFLSPLVFVYVLLGFGDFKWGATHTATSPLPGYRCNSQQSDTDGTFPHICSSVSNELSSERPLRSAISQVALLRATYDVEKQ